jgi:AcrR family transcriptional regulator
MRLVERHGIEAVTVARIADAMDWSTGTMYRYFSSKDALLAVLQVRVLARYRAALSECLSAITEGPLVEIAASVRHSVTWFLARPDHWALIGMGLAHPQPLVSDAAAEPLIAEALGLVALIAKPIGQAAANGALEPGDDAVRVLVLWAHVQGVLQMRKLTRFPHIGLNIHDVLDNGLRAILVGWGAPTDEIDAVLAAERPA